MATATAVQVRRDTLVVCIPVAVWVDGQEPESAVNAKVCLVARSCARLRLKEQIPLNTIVRLKVPARSRSTTGKVSGVFPGPGGESEIAVFADSIAAYLGIAFPDAALTAEAKPAVSASEPPPAAPAIGRPVARRLEVIVVGKDRRKVFSQTVMARVDSTGCFDVALPQELTLGTPVRVAPSQRAQEEEWLCKVSHRSAARNSQGLWEYRLSF